MKTDDLDKLLESVQPQLASIASQVELATRQIRSFATSVTLAADVQRNLQSIGTLSARAGALIATNALAVSEPFRNLAIAGAARQISSVSQSPIFAFAKEVTALPQISFPQIAVPSLAVTQQFALISARMKRSDCLEKTGWLPHYTIPWKELETGETEASRYDKIITEYYRDNWSYVRSKIEHHLDGYSTDVESKATFREALDAHQAGLYRCVCRVLIPEIERVARVELHGDTMSRITSQHQLRDLAGGLTSDDVELNSWEGLAFYGRLTEHVYKNVDATTRAKFAVDPIPNRHAALHGYVAYNSEKSSLNTLFMTEYVFQVVSAVKNAKP